MARKSKAGKIAAGVAVGATALALIGGVGYLVHDNVKEDDIPAIEEEVETPTDDEKTPEEEIAGENVEATMARLGY